MSRGIQREGRTGVSELRFQICVPEADWPQAIISPTSFSATLPTVPPAVSISRELIGRNHSIGSPDLIRENRFGPEEAHGLLGKWL